MKVKALVLLIFGTLAATTAILFIKESTIEPITLSAFRVLIAAVFLTPFYIRSLKKHPGYFKIKQLKKSFIAGLFLAAHFIFWISGGRLTPAVNGTLIINLIPVIMPFLLYFFIKEKINRNEFIATIIIIISLIILGVFDFQTESEFLLGDILCLIGMICSALYVSQARIHKAIPDIWIYLVPLYYFAGILCLIAAFIFENPLQLYDGKEYLLALGLGLIPTVFSHSSYNYAMRYLRGQIVSILISIQFVFAGFWAFLLFNENPSISFYFISPLILGSTIFIIITDGKNRSKPKLKRDKGVK